MGAGDDGHDGGGRDAQLGAPGRGPGSLAGGAPRWLLDRLHPSSGEPLELRTRLAAQSEWATNSAHPSVPPVPRARALLAGAVARRSLLPSAPREAVPGLRPPPLHGRRPRTRGRAPGGPRGPSGRQRRRLGRPVRVAPRRSAGGSVRRQPVGGEVRGPPEPGARCARVCTPPARGRCRSRAAPSQALSQGVIWIPGGLQLGLQPTGETMPLPRFPALFELAVCFCRARRPPEARECRSVFERGVEPRVGRRDAPRRPSDGGWLARAAGARARGVHGPGRASPSQRPLGARAAPLRNHQPCFTSLRHSCVACGAFDARGWAYAAGLGCCFSRCDPAQKAAGRPRYSLVWKLAFWPKDDAASGGGPEFTTPLLLMPRRGEGEGGAARIGSAAELVPEGWVG